MKTNRILVFVTNDLNQDQRMQKICSSLSEFGFDVSLIGRTKKDSAPLTKKEYSQIRLNCWFKKGVFFYIEYNLRILGYILMHRKSILYSVDLDTIFAVKLGAFLKKQPYVFDAHEWFTEAPELENKNIKKKVWHWVAGICVPGAEITITVNKSLADIFSAQFRREFIPVYNVPVLRENVTTTVKNNIPFTLIYQGVLNKGRGLEEMVDAMELIPDAVLMIVGEGDLSDELRRRASQSKAAERIFFTGWLYGRELRETTEKAHLGLNLLSATSKNYYYSLANKFFDYMHSSVPSVNMRFPEYEKIIGAYPVGMTIKTLDPGSIATAVQSVIQDRSYYQEMVDACSTAKKRFHWDNEKSKLRHLFQSLSVD